MSAARNGGSRKQAVLHKKLRTLCARAHVQNEHLQRRRREDASAPNSCENEQTEFPLQCCEAISIIRD